MRRYRYEIDNVRSHLRTLWGIIALEFVAVLALSYGLIQAPDRMIVHIPPDLRSGATVGPNEPAPPNVYAFAFYIFQQLNRWPEDGATDYSRAIYSLSPYLTPQFRSTLIAEMELKGKHGELAFRERGLQEVSGRGFSEERIEIVQSGLWIVVLDLDLIETVHGMNVKQKRIRYPIRVVRYEVDLEKNPWGLALDGFAPPGPTQLEKEGEQVEDST